MFSFWVWLWCGESGVLLGLGVRFDIRQGTLGEFFAELQQWDNEIFFNNSALFVISHTKKKNKKNMSFLRNMSISMQSTA